MKLELNGLKIAQDKTFADCARYMFTTLLSLGLPATAAGLGFEHRQEFAALFPKDVPSAGTQVCRHIRRCGGLAMVLKVWGAGL